MQDLIKIQNNKQEQELILNGKRIQTISVRDMFIPRNEEHLYPKELVDIVHNIFKDHEKKEDKHKYLYIFYNQKTKMHKIGTTKDVFRRLKTLSPSIGCEIECLYYKYIDNALAAERYFHKKYRNKCKKGEWFVLNKKDLIDIKKSLGRFL